MARAGAAAILSGRMRMERCRPTVMKPSCCAPTSWVKPTASSRCSAASTARSARSRRACGARRRGSAPASSRSWSPTCSCYIGRSLDIVHAGRVARLLRRRHRRRLRAATRPRSAMVETADRLTEDEGSLQQYLLLVGALRSLVAARARAGPHPRLVPAARAVDRGLGAELRRLRASRGAPGPHTAFVAAAGRCRVRRRARRPAPPRLDPTTSPCSARSSRATGRSRTPSDDRARNQASGVVAAYTQFHLERGLRSLQHVDRSA